MLPLLHKHSIITAALVATLGLSACGAKKDVIGAPPETSPTQSADDKKLVDDNLTNTPGGSVGEQLPDPSVGAQLGYDTLPPSTEPSYSPDDGEYSPPVAETRSAPPSEKSAPPSNYISYDIDNMTRNISKRLTGAVTSQGLVYTSSGTDSVLDFLRARNNKAKPEDRQANLAAAGSVLDAKLSIDKLSGDASITLKVQEGNQVSVYNLAGSALGGPANRLVSVTSGNGEMTTGFNSIEGTLKCLDFDGGCANMFARLKVGQSPYASIVSVIFRHSAADLYFHLPGEYSDNPEYYVLRELAINTIQRADSTNRVKTVRMESWEVVNGRSGVMLSLRAANNELLAFSAPLLAPEAGTGVNIPLARVAEDSADSLDLVSYKKTKLTYANWIGDARLIANNGLGQVRISLKMRQRGPDTADQFAITFMRKIKPLIEITEPNLK